VEKAVKLLREHVETIRINLEILEVFSRNDRIVVTDEQYLKITELNREFRESFDAFVLTTLPRLLVSEPEPNNTALKILFRDWATDHLISAKNLDSMLKEYIQNKVKAGFGS
jgi:hypothetical protein